MNHLVESMLALLRNALPPPETSLPAPSVSVASLQDRALAIGNRRGSERRGPLAQVALKGGRLEAVVRFQLWAVAPGVLDALTDELHARLLAARDQLWTAGFLKVKAEQTLLAEPVPILNAWRKTADYRVLFEYHSEDVDGAESIIARIPIHSDPEFRNSPSRETTEVTDELARWDDQGAAALEVVAATGGRKQVAGLASLAFLPALWIGKQVTLSRLHRDLTSAPTAYPTLAAFLAAVTAETNPDRHAQTVFASVSDYLGAFQSAGSPLALGDWDEDGTPDEYLPGSLSFSPPILLRGPEDLLKLSYEDAALDSKAVVYVRAEVHQR